MELERIPDRLAALSKTLGVRAAGIWRVEGDRLEQFTFQAALDLPAEVARGFSDATRSVALSDVDLGIVKAAVSGQVVVSVASELAAGAGSGYWLRAFGAARSVAVPIIDADGRVALVVAVALGPRPDDDEVASAIRKHCWSG